MGWEGYWKAGRGGGGGEAEVINGGRQERNNLSGSNVKRCRNSGEKVTGG